MIQGADKETNIQAIMKMLGVPRDEAEFIYAIETGEIDGDVIVEDAEQEPSKETKPQ